MNLPSCWGQNLSHSPHNCDHNSLIYSLSASAFPRIQLFIVHQPTSSCLFIVSHVSFTYSKNFNKILRFITKLPSFFVLLFQCFLTSHLHGQVRQMTNYGTLLYSVAENGQFTFPFHFLKIFLLWLPHVLTHCELLLSVESRDGTQPNLESLASSYKYISMQNTN